MNKKDQNKPRAGKIVSVDEYFDNLSDGQRESLTNAAIKIGRERAKALREIRELLLANQDAEALRRMRKHLDVPEKKDKGASEAALKAKRLIRDLAPD